MQAIILTERPSYDKIVIDIIYYSYRRQFFISLLSSHNNFRLFYVQIVKNVLKTKKMH